MKPFAPVAALNRLRKKSEPCCGSFASEVDGSHTIAIGINGPQYATSLCNFDAKHPLQASAADSMENAEIASHFAIVP
jgi:hypothetical protein